MSAESWVCDGCRQRVTGKGAFNFESRIAYHLQCLPAKFGRHPDTVVAELQRPAPVVTPELRVQQLEQELAHVKAQRDAARALADQRLAALERVLGVVEVIRVNAERLHTQLGQHL